MEERFYQLGTYTFEQWQEVHTELCNEGNNNVGTIPERCVSCENDIIHSKTRGTYSLTEEEVLSLKNDPRVKWIEIDKNYYPEEYQIPPEEIVATPPRLVKRLQTKIKHYRLYQGGTINEEAELNRTGYQLLRPLQNRSKYLEENRPASDVRSSFPLTFATGKDVDVIVADDAVWFGHPEFCNNTISQHTGLPVELPTDYVGGNPLPGNGYCDVLDLILDSPYYLDPDYFNANPTKLTTRFDGTIVPTELAAREWWSGNRSAKFTSVGSIFVSANYTRARSNGSNTAISTYGQHGTAVASLAYGKTMGWAYNANKWGFNLFSLGGPMPERGFDIVKTFHQYKPKNPNWNNTRNPTIMCNSWGWRNDYKPGEWYTFRGVQDQWEANPNPSLPRIEPPFVAHLGLTGDNGRWKSEMYANAMTTALDELCDAGVIFVVAAGNSNQKQVLPGHPDFDNFIALNQSDTLYDTSYYEFGDRVTGSTNRPGFPQQAGFYDTPDGGRVYRSINVGALDDSFKNFTYNAANVTGERKVNYSDRGEAIDIYAPADQVFAADHSYGGLDRADTYPQLAGYIVPKDCRFAGTSAACPVATGFIAAILELNRDWDIHKVKQWCRSLPPAAENEFYRGDESTTPDTNNWYVWESLEGGVPRVLHFANIPARYKKGRREATRGGLKFKGNIGFRIRK